MSDPAQIITVIRPTSGAAYLNLSEVWRARELICFLAWRDISVRYKQAVLGITWAVIQPLFTMIVFSLFFGLLAKMPSNDVPYPLFALAALVPWQLFAFALTESSNSVVANQNLITKVYFPRLVIPLASTLAGLADFAVAFALLLGVMLWYGLRFSAWILALPFFVSLALTTALGMGLWLSALNVRYRDVRYTLPFLVQLWLFATPIAYPLSLVPAKWQPLYAINPMVAVVEGFRGCLLATPFPSARTVGVSAVAGFAMVVTGAIFFRRTERQFADLI